MVVADPRSNTCIPQKRLLTISSVTSTSDHVVEFDLHEDACWVKEAGAVLQLEDLSTLTMALLLKSL